MKPFEKLVIGNSGGMVKTLEDVERFCNTPATRIKVGGITKLFRTGNTPVPPGGLYYFDPKTKRSGNAYGLPNRGMEGYRTLLPLMVQMAHANGKELWVNINGESVAEIIELVIFCFSCGVDGVEINLACPNVHDKGTTKPLFCEDPALVAEILERLLGQDLLGKQISIKISPTDNDELVVSLCDVISTIDIITEVVATNTRGGQRFIENGVDMIAFRPPGSNEVKYVGGEAGAPLHARAIEICKIVRKNLPDHVGVIGIGGNFTGGDVVDFLKLDVNGFECGTAIAQGGPEALKKIIYETGEHYD